MSIVSPDLANVDNNIQPPVAEDSTANMPETQPVNLPETQPANIAPPNMQTTEEHPTQVDAEPVATQPTDTVAPVNQ